MSVRMLRNETGLARRISPAVAAGYWNPASTGSPLRADIRSEMERAFGADFSAVRIHTDSAAAASAQAEYAIAFTSGRDIYFDFGRFKPDALEGKRLLAHELTHVLQQTGRTSAGNKRAATTVPGSGEIQRQDFYPDGKPTFLDSPDKAFEALATRHGNRPDADESLKGLIKFVGGWGGNRLYVDESTVMAGWMLAIAKTGEYNDTHRSTVVKLSAPARDFLFDCLKVTGTKATFEAAALLLDADPTFAIKTTFGPREKFREYLKPRGEDWLAPAFEYEPLKSLWTRRFVSTVEQFLFSPWRSIQSLEGFTEAKAAAFDNFLGVKPDLLSNDRMLMAFELLSELDSFRITVMSRIEADIAKRRPEEPEERRRMRNAEELFDYLEKFKPEPMTEIRLKMLQSWKALAAKATNYWRFVIGIDVAVNTILVTAEKKGVDKIRSFVEMNRPFAEDDPLMAPLRKALMSVTAPGGLFFLDDTGKITDVPAPEEYQKRIRALEKTIDLEGRLKDNFLLSLQQQLLRAHHKGGLESMEVVVLGWVMLWTSEFATLLKSYSAKKDDRKYADGRLAHRYRLAEKMLVMAQVAHWADLHDLVGRILLGKDVDASYLAVPGQWEVKADFPVHQMEIDLPGKIVGFHGMESKHLARFFYSKYLESLTDTINKTVDQSRKDPKEKLDQRKLKQSVDALPRPWRCEPDRTHVLVLRDEDSGPFGKISNFDIIESSRKSLDELTRLSAARGLGANWKWVALSKPPLVDPILAWIVPDLTAIITLLRGSEPFISRMTAYESLGDEEWLDTLINLGGTISDDITAAVDASIKGASLEFIDALRQLTALKRRNQRALLASTLSSYKPTFKYMDVRKEVAERIWQFASDPSDDYYRQRALLILSLAPNLNDAFHNARRAAALPPFFFDALTATLKFVDETKQDLASASADQRKKIEEVLFRNEKYPDRAEHIQQDFLVHEDEVKQVARHMEEARLEMQEEWGFRSTDGRTLQSVGESYEIEPGEKNTMEIGGNDWELVEVHNKFTYHPSLAFSAMTSSTKDPIVKDGSGKRLRPGEPLKLATFLKNGDEFEVIANNNPPASGDLPDGQEMANRKELAELTEALYNHTRSVMLGKTADALEGLGNFMIEVMELIPAIGQELMIARLGIMIVKFTDEIPKIVKALKDHPLERLETFANDLKEHLPETMIKFFILGHGLEPFGNRRRPADDTTGVKVTGKFAKVISILRRIGRRLADALRWVRLRVAGPAHSLHSSIVTRPMLAWLLSRAVDTAFWIRRLQAGGVTGQELVVRVLDQLMPADEEKKSADPAQGAADPQAMSTTVGTQMTAETGDFKTRLSAMLEHLGEGVLPSVLIPLANIIEFLFDFFLSRLGAKVAIARSVLQYTKEYQDLRSLVANALADFVEGSRFDPNLYWQTYILDPIDERLLEARNGLVEGIYGRTNTLAESTEITFLGLGKPDLKQKGQFGLKREGDPMAESYTVHGAVPKRGRLGELPATAGQPLAAAVRLIEERRFGHDLRHVRIHTGDDTGSNLNKIGARAVTSGSHVFFRPGLDPRSSLGARVLRHELTHVLQQTGPRPKDRAQDARPLRGRPRAGLIVDQMREAAADAMAKADSAVAREPIEVNSGAEGVQPNLEEAVTDVLSSFTTFESAGDFEATTADEKVPGAADAKGAWNKLAEGLKGEINHKKFVGKVLNLLRAHIAATVQETDILRVAAMAQQPGPKAKGKGRRPKDTTLDFPRFVTLLEGFLLARTGVGMQLKFINPPKLKLTSIELVYVHLGVIPPTSKTGKPLWDEVMQTADLGGGDDPAELRAELYARLAALGPDPFVWDFGVEKFRFSADFVKAFNKVRIHGGKRKLEKKLIIPPKAKYLDPSTQDGIALGIGTHKGQKGTDRESHHTTQYLLVQYFRNHIATIPAWQKDKEYPGIYPKKGQDREYFQGADRRLELYELDRLESSRGAGMPAILVSADLHKRGRLHINREGRWSPDDEEDTDSKDDQGGGPVRQGFAIQRQFKTALKSKFKVSDETLEWNGAVEAKRAAGEKPERLIQEAMIETYHWMHEIMLPALKHGLFTRELAYYRGIAARDHSEPIDTGKAKLKSEYDLTAQDMTNVYGRALANNDTVMSKAGWRAP